MRVLATLALLCGLALVVAGPADARKRHHHKAPCSAKRSKTLLSNGAARVYRTGSEQFDIYGCLYRTNKRRRIASYSSCDCSRGDEPQPGLWLSGRVVAVNPWGCPPLGVEGSCTGRIRSVDLASGRTLREHDTGGFVADVALKPNGSLGYIAGGAVSKLDGDGYAVLDPGPGVDPASLALSRSSVLYWTTGGAPRSAPLR